MPFLPNIPPFVAIPGPRRCAAKSKQSGRRCRQIAAPGKSVCRFHGGKSLSGRAHPAYTDGEATQAARAEMRHVNRLGKALRLIDRAVTAEELRAADAFARRVLGEEHDQGSK